MKKLTSLSTKGKLLVVRGWCVSLSPRLWFPVKDTPFSQCTTLETNVRAAGDFAMVPTHLATCPPLKPMK